MKKLLIIAIIGSAGLFSCNKDWTCTCVNTDNVGVETTSIGTILNTTKEIASSNCLGSEDPNGQWKNVCEIKAAK